MIFQRFFLLSHATKDINKKCKAANQAQKGHISRHIRRPQFQVERFFMQSQLSPTDKSLAFLIQSYRTILRICALVDKARGIYQADPNQHKNNKLCNKILGRKQPLKLYSSNTCCRMEKQFLLPPFQIISSFGFSIYIDFAMNLEIAHIQLHSKRYVPRKAKTTYKLKQREYKENAMSIVKA